MSKNLFKKKVSKNGGSFAFYFIDKNNFTILSSKIAILTFQHPKFSFLDDSIIYFLHDDNNKLKDK
jgi:hypothetical protein